MSLNSQLYIKCSVCMYLSIANSKNKVKKNKLWADGWSICLYAFLYSFVCCLHEVSLRGLDLFFIIIERSLEMDG
jgi:hypothetical protein